jgi:N-acetylglutamate synthase-like GNAT family acetyltransferase
LTELTHIFVKFPYRKRSIGSELLKHAIDKAKSAGVPLSLVSEPASHTFYQKHGFKDLKHVEFNLAEWDDAEYTGFGPFRLYAMVLDP